MRPMGPSSKRLRHTGHRLVSGAAAQNADRFTRNRSFSAQFNEVACGLGSTTPRVADSLPSDGGNCIIRDLTRRQPAPHAAKPPHPPTWTAPHRRQDRAQCRLARQNSPSTRPPAAHPRKNSPNTGVPSAYPRKSSPSKPKNAEIGVFSARWANFFALTPTIGPRRANYFAHRAQRRGGFETNDTSAATDAGQHETTITTAHPRTATVETGATSATEKRTKNTHFSPAKATAVSAEARPARAKATWVSIRRKETRAKVPPVSARQRVAPNRQAMHPFTHQHTKRRRCGGRRRDRRVRPGFETTRRTTHQHTRRRRCGGRRRDRRARAGFEARHRTQ